MKQYILDTDTLIYLLKGNEKIVRRLTELPAETIHTTIVNHAELFFGAYNSERKKLNLMHVQNLLMDITIMPFCEEASRIFAKQKALLKKEGNIIADLDLMIASICLRQQMILVTNNIKHFARIKKLEIENWAHRDE